MFKHVQTQISNLGINMSHVTTGIKTTKTPAPGVPGQSSSSCCMVLSVTWNLVATPVTGTGTGPVFSSILSHVSNTHKNLQKFQKPKDFSP